jgi:AcrR family transcriptional regulator
MATPRPARRSGRADGKPAPTRRRRQEILDAAALIFHEKGYESTSIQDIADAVGILKGSLYYYIDTKEDLLYDILCEVHQTGDAALARVEATDGSALVKIRAFVHWMLLINTGNLAKVAVFFHDYRSLSPERQRAIIGERDRTDELLRRLIRDGQEEGTICPDVDPKIAGIGVLGLLNWIYHWYRPGRGGLEATELAKAYADFVVAGLACDHATHRAGHRATVGAAAAG